MRTANGVVVYSPTGVFTIYDLQSNAVPQTVWQDPNNSQNVHAVFITSSEQGFADRGCTYLYSSNFGSTWQNRGPSAPGEMGSFSAVSGLSTGQAVISTYNTQNGTPRRLKI